jgi:hypothetical protein
MNELRYTAKVENGQVKFTDRKGFDMDMKALEGLKLSIRIKRFYKTRSTKQNAFYWSNFIPSQIDCFVERFGERYRADQMHEWNKLNFFGEERVNELTGEMIRLPASTSDQSTVEFEEALEKCREWFLLNFDWPLPYPLQQSEFF